MTKEEIERLKQLNCALFKRGYARVRSISEWEERCRTDTVRKHCSRRT
jgi:hypothetical protein